MSPSLLSILLHLGKILGTIKDFEKTVADAAGKKEVGPDLKADLLDVLGLLVSGLVVIPGVSADALAQVVAEVQAL